MKLTALRWLLDPATSLLALRLRSQERGRISYDAAWRLARVKRHPEEIIYRHSECLAEDPRNETW